MLNVIFHIKITLQPKPNKKNVIKCMLIAQGNYHTSLMFEDLLLFIRPSGRPPVEEKVPLPPVLPKPVAKPPPPTPELSEVEVPTEEYKRPSVAEAKKRFDQPEEYQAPPAKVPKPAEAPAPKPTAPPVPASKQQFFIPREKSPRSNLFHIQCYRVLSALKKCDSHQWH